MIHDVIIVGGGPAGLSAALYALRAGKRALVLEKNNFGGQIAWSPRIENYPGVMAVSGAEFSDNLLAQVLDKGGEIELTEVARIDDAGDKKIVRTADGDFEARAVILATGAKHRRLGLPREEVLTGNGVSYCAVCDGAFYKGRTVAVVGGGDAALQDALLLSASCQTVYIIHRREAFRAEAANVDAVNARPNIRFLMSSTVTALEGEGALSGITVESLRDGSRTRIPVDGLFIAVGFEPENDGFAGLADLDADGWFAAGEDCLSRTPGIFVAGDCRAKEVRQLATAVGDGAVAAVSACRFVDGLAK
jgi:thioredoxin reductase (NADPH)